MPWHSADYVDAIPTGTSPRGPGGVRPMPDADDIAYAGHEGTDVTGALDARPPTHLSASSAPTTSDDETQEHVVGCRWIKLDTGTVYTAVDVSTGAAVWASGGGGSGIDVDGDTGTVSGATELEIVGGTDISVAVTNPSGSIARATVTYTGTGGGGASVPTKLGGWNLGGNTTNPALTIASQPSGTRIILATNLVGRAVTSVACTNVTWTKVAGPYQPGTAYYELWVGVVSGGSSGTTITVSTASGNYFSLVAMAVTDALTPTAGTPSTQSLATAYGLIERSGDTSGRFVAMLIGADNTTNPVLAVPYLPAAGHIGMGTNMGMSLFCYHAPAAGAFSVLAWNGSSVLRGVAADIT